VKLALYKSSTINTKVGGMQRLSIYLLGSFQVRLDDELVTARFRTEKERALLAFLAIESGRAHSREMLAELLWPERPEGVARTNLRQALLGVRRAISDHQASPPYLLVSDISLQFNLGAQYWLDCEAFETRIQSAAQHPHPGGPLCPACAQRYAGAVDLYRGDFLSESLLRDNQAFQEWVTFRQEGYQRRFLEALSQLSRHYQELGDYDRACSFSRRQVNLDPLDEGAHRQLMRALALSGHRSAALAQYRKLTALLEAELGLEPTPESASLYDQIRSGYRLDPSRPARLARRDNLPVQLTSFIGREEELKWFADCLSNPTCRFLSVTGMPGAGKTRLATQAAAAHAQDFPDGVGFVSLTGIHTREALLARLAQAYDLNLDGPHSQDEQVCRQLRGLKTLILLDGFDDLLAETDLVLRILDRAPGVKLLVTSRRRLDYQSACLLELGGLECSEASQESDPEACNAVRLFRDRAVRSWGGLRLGLEGLEAIRRICRLVEGNPLALELAAAAHRECSLKQILDRLHGDLDVLTTSLKDLPEHQRSMRAAFETSWEGLTLPEQGAYRRISVFDGQFSQKEAGQVAQASPAALASLVNSSLLNREAPDRYRLAHLSRLYAADKLAVHPEDLAQVKTRWREFRAQNKPVRETTGESRAWADVKLENIDLKSIPLPANSGSPGLAEGWCCGREGSLEDANLALLLVSPHEAILDANFQATQLTGYPQSELIAMNTLDLEVGGSRSGFSGAGSPFEVSIRSRDGAEIPVEITALPVAWGQAMLFITLLRDLRPGASPRVWGTQPSLRDPVTRLPNRELFFDRLRHGISLAARQAHMLALLLLEVSLLDEETGETGAQRADLTERADLAMQAIVRRLRSRLRQCDTIARIGESDFAFLIENLPNADDAAIVARKILEELTPPIAVAGDEINLTAGIGVCLYPLDGDDPESLLQHADQAIQEVKHSGESGYRFFRS
jgi:diguanylate cyclase (GGDEF)-like protein